MPANNPASTTSQTSPSQTQESTSATSTGSEEAPTSPRGPKNTRPDRLSPGAIAGIVVGTVVGTALICYIGYGFILLRRMRASKLRAVPIGNPMNENEGPSVQNFYNDTRYESPIVSESPLTSQATEQPQKRSLFARWQRDKGESVQREGSSQFSLARTHSFL